MTSDTYHPHRPTVVGNASARGDYTDVWRFPCCGQVVVSDVEPFLSPGCQKRVGVEPLRSRIPRLTTFRGWLRDHRPYRNNVWGEAVFRFAFPWFAAPVWTGEEIERVRANAYSTLKHLVLQPAQHRRYGGYDLERGCYHSLCSDQSGDDFGTLSAELNAYRNRTDQTAIVEVIDGLALPEDFFEGSTIPNQIRRVKNASIFVSIFPASRLRQAIEEGGEGQTERMSNPEALLSLTD